MDRSAEEVPRPDRKHRFRVDVVLGLMSALALGTVLKIFVLGAVFVPSASMEGTLLAGDFVLVDKLGRSSEILVPNLIPGGSPWMVRTPGFRQTRRGDIVLFRRPPAVLSDRQSGDRFFLKRCVATGGDTVEFRGGGIVVNGQMLLLPATAAVWNDPDRAYTADQGTRVAVPEGCLFLLGDNPLRSSDSRMWGCIPECDVIGRVVFIYWSKHAAGETTEHSGAIRWERIGTVLR
jgi:signal peptidase I